MDYIKLFNNEQEYEQFLHGRNYVVPNVSYCVSEQSVHYSAIDNVPEPEPEPQILTFTAQEDNSSIAISIFSFTIEEVQHLDDFVNLHYSTDNGETWNNYTFTVTLDSAIVANGEIINLDSGDTVMFKGISQVTGIVDEYTGEKKPGFQFTMEGTISAHGDVTSLYNGIGGNIPMSSYSFCYMFSGCSLTTAPNLPSTTLADYCYYGIFNGCTALTTVQSVLPATTLSEGCYEEMFYYCSSLTTAPELPATTLADNCYREMFYDCTALTTVQSALPATTLTENCYENMFYDCSSLTTAPELPATTLADYCYKEMFSYCTALTTVQSALPATTLSEGCYANMFYDCSSLTTAPELPATTLVSNCYSYMFAVCSNLNYIKAMFTTTPSYEYTDYWVGEVAQSGTFVKNSAAEWDVSGNTGIPTGWTVQTASE